MLLRKSTGRRLRRELLPCGRAKKETLPALTGLRCFAALNIVFFHFSNPKWFGPFAPIVDNGYTSVSFFLLMSGYILAYNYADRAAAGQLKHAGFLDRPPVTAVSGIHLLR